MSGSSPKIECEDRQSNAKLKRDDCVFSVRSVNTTTSDTHSRRTSTVWPLTQLTIYSINDCLKSRAEFRLKCEAVVVVMCVCVCVRESLIDKRIESAVSQMQSVIELGRVIRDRKTLPVKVS